MSRIFVGNIPHSSSEIELQQRIESYGFPVESARIMRDSRSASRPCRRAWYFISFDDSQSCNAPKRIHGIIITGAAREFSLECTAGLQLAALQRDGQPLHERGIHFKKHGRVFSAHDEFVYERIAGAFMFGAMNGTTRKSVRQIAYAVVQRLPRKRW
jgi:hypothetical protein